MFINFTVVALFVIESMFKLVSGLPKPSVDNQGPKPSAAAAVAVGNQTKMFAEKSEYEWMWLLGNNVGNQETYFDKVSTTEIENSIPGTKEIYPGSRAGSAFWVDHTGLGWMFGGKGFGEGHNERPGVLQDLWTFNVLRKKWTLKDSGRPDVYNLSGHLHPGARHMGAACGVHRLAFLAFGGEDQFDNVRNDTWVFDIPSNMWLPLTKVKGPVNRKDMAYWCYKSKIIIFGGEGNNKIMLDDLWEFSLRRFEWKIITPVSVSLTPLGRNGAISWRGNSKYLYMYGGQRIDKEEHGFKVSLMSDLWMFDITNNSWSLVHSGETVANYGTLGISSNRNTPGPRKHSASWVVGDTLWLYGGVGCGDGTQICHTHSMLADLWMFELNTSQWVWQGGSKHLDFPPVYGLKGSSHNKNSPGSRCGSVAWSHQGLGFLFGGIGKDGRYRTSYLNDLWLLGKANKTYVLTTQKSWFHSLHPGLIFFMVLISIAGIVLSFGAIFFLKKMIEYSRHRTNSGDFKVRYSPINQEATLET